MKAFILFIFLLFGALLDAQQQVVVDCEPTPITYNVRQYKADDCNWVGNVVPTEEVWQFHTYQVAAMKTITKLPVGYLVIENQGLYKIYIHPKFVEQYGLQFSKQKAQTDGFCSFVKTTLIVYPWKTGSSSYFF